MWKDKHPKKWLLLAALFILALIGFLIFAGIRAQASPDKNFLPIKEITTAEGIKIWMVEDDTLPIVAMRFLFLDSGTALDPKDRQGLARLLSNTMDEGAGDLSSQEFQKQLSDYSITLRFDASRDGFGGELKTLTRNKEKAFDLLTLALNEPRFDDEPLGRMKNANLSRIRSSLSNPDWLAARLINDRAFEGHPYGLNSGGTLSSLPAITADDLRAFRQNNLTKDRLLIAVTGDITAQKISPLVDQVFANLPKTSSTAPLADTHITNAGKIFLHEQNVPQTMVQIMLPAFDQRDDDYHALQILNYIFGGAGFGSRLMEEARERQGLTYGIYSSLQDYRHADAMAIYTSTKNESADAMLKIIRDEMEKMKTTLVSAEDLQNAKSYITGSMPLGLTSTDAIASTILSLRAKDLPIDYLDSYADKINAVTAQQIQSVARRVFNTDAMTIALVGKPENIQNAIIVEELPNVR